MKKLMPTLAICLMFSPAVQAADTPRTSSALPAYGKDKPIPTPQIAKKTLANGLTVWVVPRKGLPRVDFVLALRGAGFAADDRQHAGFATGLANLLNEGTIKRDSRAIAEAAQGMGGAVGAGATHDGIVVSANALAASAGQMLQLLAEVARTPSFPAKEVQLAKVNALQALKASEAQPGFRAERALTKAIYGEHPYATTTPTVESINAITGDYLKAEHAKRFRPDRALLVVTGRITEADAMTMATAAFSDWKASGPALAETPGASLNAKPARIVLNWEGSVQSTVRLGSPGTARRPSTWCHCA